MSMFDRDNFRWRETYFVLFDSRRRPPLATVEERIRRHHEHFELKDTTQDESGRFETLTLIAPDDCAAVEISYLEGQEVLDQGATLAAELKDAGAIDVEPDQLLRLPECDARFEVMHFEQIFEDGVEDELEGSFDPTPLLTVLETLSELTDGICVDPQSGTLL